MATEEPEAVPSDDAPEPAATTGSGEHIPEEATKKRWVQTRQVFLGVCAVALAVIAVLASLLAVEASDVSSEHALNAARTSALSVAKVDAVEVASYDYRHLTSDFGAVEHHATTTFAKRFGQTSAALRKVLVQYHAIAKAKILDAGVVSATTTRVVIVLFLNQTVTNTAQTSGSSKDQSRILMTLVKPGSVWLLDQLKVI